MKITIDTKEDSKEEIRKAVRMLSAIAGDSGVYANREQHSNKSNIFSDEPDSAVQEDSSPSQNAFANMFGAASSQQAPGNAPEAGESKEENEEKPRIQVIDY